MGHLIAASGLAFLSRSIEMAQQPDIEPQPYKHDTKHAEENPVEIEAEALLDGKDPRIKAIKRKTDLRICGLLGLLYMMAAIDRVNLGVRCRCLAEFC